MSASTALITDITSVITNGPAATTTAKAIAAAGPIMDYPGQTKLMLLRFQEAAILLAKIKTDTDGSDPNLTNINAVLAALNGTSAPSGTVITAMLAVYQTAFTAASEALAIAAAGPIMGLKSNSKSVLDKLRECARFIVDILVNTDVGTDGTNRTLLLNIQTCLT